MKRLIVLILFSLTFAGNCRANTITIDQSPNSVIFYQQGAEVSYDFTVNLKKGTNTIIFKSLPSQTDENSFRMSSDGNVLINSASFELEKYESKDSPELIKLQDSMKLLNFKLDDIQNKQQILQGEEKIISSFNLNENEKGASVQDLKTHAEYYSKRVGEIRASLLKLKKETKLIEEKKKIISFNILAIKQSSASNQFSSKRYYMTAVIKSNTVQKINMTFSFYTIDAGWQPVYDIKIDEKYTKLDLTYKAKIWQKTGYDWENADITVSTRNPSVNGVYRELRPWYVGNNWNASNSFRYEPKVVDKRSEMQSNTLAFVPAGAPISIDGMDVGSAFNTYFSYEYHPNEKHDVKSSANGQTISLKSEEIKCDFEHFIIPSRDIEAYLVAKIPDWSKYSLLPGPAKVYFGNSYVGKTHISTNNADEKLSISLGKSKGILAERETLKKYTETKFFSSNVEKKFGYKIKIRNNRSENIKVTVQDQIPVSTHESFQIDLLRSDGAKLKKSTGVLEWKLDLDPGETVEKIFVFEADIPKGQTLGR